jgi:peptidoglycan hydrolase CwlO-like protein
LFWGICFQERITDVQEQVTDVQGQVTDLQGQFAGLEMTLKKLKISGNTNTNNE